VLAKVKTEAAGFKTFKPFKMFKSFGLPELSANG